MAAIVLLALAFRLDGINRPLSDHHSWRQCDTAAIARNYVEEDSNFFQPRIDWRGESSGAVEWNFPVFPYLVSLIYRLVGVRDIAGRLLAVVFSIIAIWLLYWLARRRFDQPTATVAAAFMAVNPLAAYFGRTFMPESLLLASSLAALLAFDLWLKKKRTSLLILTAACLTLAGLIKIPFGFLAIPLAFLLVEERGWRGCLDWRVWLAGTTALITVASWYVHARGTGQSSGLSYAPIWSVGADKWGNAELLASSAFWSTIGDRLIHYVSPSATVIVSSAGLVVCWARREARWVLAWLAGVVVYLLLIAGGHQAHTYYQLAFVGPVALGFSLGLLWAVRKAQSARAPVQVLTWVMLAVVIVGGLREGNFRFKRMSGRRSQFAQAGAAVKQITESADRLIAVGPCCMSEPFYHSERKGWHASFESFSDVDAWVADKIAKGARAAFLTTAYAEPISDLVCEDRLARWFASRFRPVSEGKNHLVLDLRVAEPRSLDCPGTNGPAKL